MRHVLAASLIEIMAIATPLRYTLALHLTWSALQGASGSITDGNKSYGNKSFRKVIMKS
jgi:hypothetical protein